MGLIRSNSIEIGQWFEHTCIDCFSCNVFLEANNLLSSFRVGFYSSFLVIAVGSLIPNGLEVESQPIKACKKRSCLAFPKSWANLFMLYRRLTFPTLSKVKIRSYPFWSTKMLSSTKIFLSSPMTSERLNKTNDSKSMKFVLDGGFIFRCALQHLRGMVLHLTLLSRLMNLSLLSSVDTSQVRQQNMWNIYAGQWGKRNNMSSFKQAWSYGRQRKSS